MKQLFFLLLFSHSFLSSNAQPASRNGQAARGHVYGKVVEEKSKRGLDAVSIQLIRIVKGVNGEVKDSVVAGMFTKSNGDFDFNNILLSDSISVKITAIGYGSLQQRVGLMPKNSNLTDEREVDLGNFVVALEPKVLGNVTVTATRPVFEMGIDRKIFNVEKSITATGGTAIDVMRNIPSVTVDVDGNISLRNSTPQVFVDGRPTILTLDQIPADNIEKVELITNPSAKFDAASSGGIVNVILKKNKRIGLNGNVSLSAGAPSILASSLSLNLREGKFNFFVSGNYNKSGGKADSKTFRQNRSNSILQNYFNQYSTNNRTREFKSARFGIDYFIDNRNTLTVTQSFVDGRFGNLETQTQEYLNTAKVMTRTGLRTSTDDFNFTRQGSQLLYTHKFSKTGQQFTADATYNTGTRGGNSSIINSYYNTDGTAYSAPNRALNNGQGNNDQLTVQIDYANPIGENAKLETGVRSYINNNTSIFDAFSLGQNEVQTKLPLSNYYKYKEVINAFYLTFSNKINRFAYQAGFRAETSKFDGELVDKGEKFGYSYPEKLKNIWDALFPSLYLTQTLNDHEELQLNYSRRIRRPNFWQINPFVDINDPVNIRQGNPALRPEFTNSYEFNYSRNYTGGNFLAAIYHRNTLGDITQYSDTISATQYDQLKSAGVDPNAILNTYINVKNQNRWGLDITWQHNISKNLEIIPNFNLQYRKINADLGNINLSNQGLNWEGKLITNYKFNAEKSWLFKNLSLQLTGEYESSEVIPQGRRKPQYSLDFAFRKEMLKDKKGTLTFGIDDVLNKRRSGVIYDTDNFYQDSYRRWNVRSFRVTFSFKFGDSDFSLFKKRPERPMDEASPSEG